MFLFLIFLCETLQANSSSDGLPTNKQASEDEPQREKLSSGMDHSSVKNKLPYALRSDRPHFKYPNTYFSRASPEFGDSAFVSDIPEDEYPVQRKKRHVRRNYHHTHLIINIVQKLTENPHAFGSFVIYVFCWFHHLGT